MIGRHPTGFSGLQGWTARKSHRGNQPDAEPPHRWNCFQQSHLHQWGGNMLSFNGKVGKSPWDFPRENSWVTGYGSWLGRCWATPSLAPPMLEPLGLWRLSHRRCQCTIHKPQHVHLSRSDRYLHPSIHPSYLSTYPTLPYPTYLRTHVYTRIHIHTYTHKYTQIHTYMHSMRLCVVQSHNYIYTHTN